MTRTPMMSGHCNFPQTKNPEVSHARCNGGNTWNPDKEFIPCPCSCHLGETYECQCGGTIREAPCWPNEDEPDEITYVHVDTKTGRAIGPECFA